MRVLEREVGCSCLVFFDIGFYIGVEDRRLGGFEEIYGRFYYIVFIDGLICVLVLVEVMKLVFIMMILIIVFNLLG